MDWYNKCIKTLTGNMPAGSEEIIMLKYDYKKEYHLQIEPNLREMRIRMSPTVELENENMFIVDRLESAGVIRVMEHIKGVCEPIDADGLDGCTDAVTLAEIRVSAQPETREVQVGSIFFEYGFDDLVHVLMQMILFFSDFYDYKVSILNLRKSNISQSREKYTIGRRLLQVVH